MGQFLAYVISGLVAGALYALMASGLVLSYTASGVLNFAQGSIGFVTAVVYFELNTGLHWGIVPSAIVALGIFAPGLGYVLYRLMFRRLAHAGETAQIVATIGLLVALPALALWVVERLINTFHFDLPSTVNEISPPGLGPTPKHFLHLPLGVTLDSNQVVTFIAAALVAVLLWLVLRSPAGLRMRATADRRDLAALRGVNPDQSSAVAWVLSSSLAGLVGVLAAPIYGLDASGYTLLLFLSMTAAVFGRLRSVPLTFLAGLLLGVVQNLVAGYATFAKSITGFNNAVPIILLLIGLLVLNRERGRIAGSVAEDAPPPDYLADLPSWRRALPWTVALGALLVYMFTIGTSFWIGTIAQGLIFSVIFLSFIVVTGLGGMVSFAQATFVTAAALMTGALYAHGIPLGLAALAGVVTATTLGVVFATPALRLGGRVLALATLALALLGDQALFQLPQYNNQGAGWALPSVAIGPFQLTDPRTMAVFLLIVVAVVALVVRNLERSSSGRGILAVRAGPAAAMTSGVSSTRVKLLIFAVSAAIAGLGGVLYAVYQGRTDYTDFPAETGFVWLAAVVIFGVRRPGAAIVAGLVAAIMPQLFAQYVTTSAYIPAILFGLGGIGLAQQPDGALAQMAEQRYRKRRGRRDRQLIEHVIEQEQEQETRAPHAAAPAITQLARTPSLTAEDLSEVGPPILRLDRITAGYGESVALRDVSLVVPQGSVVALLGANGAGKSTICRVASRSHPVTAGRVYFAGQDVTHWPAHRVARAGLFTAPEARGIFPGLTVEENVALCVGSGENREEIWERFPALAQRRRVAAGALSGGEQQMLALSPMLVSPPTLAVADEPSLGLAPRIVDELFQVFTDIRDKGTSLLLAEEKADELLRIADYVVFVRTGSVVWAGPAAEVDAERLAEAYLGLAEDAGKKGEAAQQ